MDVAWGKEGEGKTTQNFGWKNLKERCYLKDLNADGEDNIEIDLKQVGWQDVNQINLATELCERGNEQSGSTKFDVFKLY